MTLEFDKRTDGRRLTVVATAVAAVEEHPEGCDIHTLDGRALPVAEPYGDVCRRLDAALASRTR